MALFSEVEPEWVIGSSTKVLFSFIVLALAGAALYWTGTVGRLLWFINWVVGSSVRQGFHLWKQFLSWASWPSFLTAVLVLAVVGATGGQPWPALALAIGLILLFAGLVTCLAYVFLDLERYEVARGYKALHNPLMGQELAANLVQYGRQVGVPLLIAASVSIVAGFALANEGFYETFGRDWFTVPDGESEPAFSDFLAYTLINLFRVADLLNIADSYHVLHFPYVHQAKWPASVLSTTFRGFFTLVLLEQLFSSLRRGKLLTETVTDFWSPHEPIHERARGALPQHGPGAAWPLLRSLRSVSTMTAEQRAFVPRILADIGPSTVPVLTHHLDDAHENVRGVVVLALGYLHALDAVPVLVKLEADSSDWVRQSLAESLGVIAETIARPGRDKSSVGRRLRRSSGRWLQRLLRRSRREVVKRPDEPVVLAVATLRRLLADSAAGVRAVAARSLGQMGPAATAAVPDLISLAGGMDEAARCQAAEALGRIGATSGDTLGTLVRLLEDPALPVRTSAAMALGTMKEAAAEAVPALLPLLQERSDSLRLAAAEALGRIGNMQDEAIPALTEGLASQDNVVRAQTAEALGTIGAPAAEATAALAGALGDSNDRVRAKAAEALGKMGESAAEAVPHLVRALRDKDNWVSALAAEALGEMGNGAARAVPSLVRSLRHLNPQVRANAAEALGKLGETARDAIPSLGHSAGDEDGEVRSHAVLALGEIGNLDVEARQVLLAAMRDPLAEVRAAAVQAIGKRQELQASGVAVLLDALADPSEAVKVQLAQALPKLAGASPAVVDALRRLLTEDPSATVQAYAAAGLGTLGPDATAAGQALVRVAQTGEAEVRERSLRALIMIQPPEAVDAFRVGLKDAVADIRMVASAGLLKAGVLPLDVVSELVEALRDPEVQVRANVARLLAAMDPLPAEAVTPLVECATDLDDGLRLNAVLALRSGPPGEVAAVFQQMLRDPNQRLRLIAAGWLLNLDPADAPAGAVLVETLADTRLSYRRAAVELIESLGARGSVFLDTLRQRVEAEVDPELSGSLCQLVEQLDASAIQSELVTELGPPPALEKGEQVSLTVGKK